MFRMTNTKHFCFALFKLSTSCLIVILLWSCGTTSGGSSHSGENPTDNNPGTNNECWQPSLSNSWQWQLNGTVNTSYDVDIYDIDLEDSSSALISQLHTDGCHVICYFSAGSYENWRSDANQFDAEDLGNTLAGWPDERWLDITSDNVRAIMEERLDRAVSKGCDAVEADNVDGYSNSNGLGLTAAEQLDYNQFLAQAAHERGLAIGLKNDLEQISSLVSLFDFAINEQCYEYDECSALTPFISAGKPVFHVEYKTTYLNDNSMCLQSRDLNLRTLILPKNLDDSYPNRYSCDGN